MKINPRNERHTKMKDILLYILAVAALAAVLLTAAILAPAETGMEGWAEDEIEAYHYQVSNGFWKPKN